MAVVASAPGKVLMTGGYLVLEKPNAGLVLSTNARFYAIVKPIYEEIKPDSWAWSWTDIKLTSPQLLRESIYKLSLKNQSLESVSPSQSRNPFVERAVEYCVAAASAKFVDKDNKNALHKLLLQGLDITILGCNEFYSYRSQIEARGLPLTSESLASLPPFSSITFNDEESLGKNCKPEVAKTGLGSSAAMTAAVVAALLNYLGVVNLSLLTGDQEQRGSAGLDLVHIIAQSAHCIAQGKVGSGFDVSSAVYGSQRYVRFSPEVLSSAQAAKNGIPIEEVIVDILNQKWDHERTKFSLPPLMTLVLGEPGVGGSSTPSMWIHQATEPSQQAIIKALLGARNAMLQIRHHMRSMGEAAGVPIEPDSQTKLLDATMNMEGVLLAGVPGAGGFDAVFAVTLGDSTSNVTKSWSSLDILALLVREDPRGVALESCDPRTNAITAAVSSVHI
uniref:phosphomevalonate kinase n=1 Tax=Cucumis sativus TaxID=3659 RepID=A0A0A0LJZ3_CUCSA